MSTHAMTLLGCGTAVPDADRENTHMVWRSPEGLLLVDAGGSTWQRLLRAALDPLRLRGVFLTHSHADHINGLPALLFQLSLLKYEGSLPVFGNSPTLEIAHRVVEAFRLEKHQVATEWITVEPEQAVPTGMSSFRLRTAATVHPRPCLALRFEVAATGAALTYSADTEPCAAVDELARGSAVLIHEATTPQPFAGHTTPRQAGEIAARAGVGRLVLVHFSPRWTMPEEQALAEVRASGFTGPAEVGKEFATYPLPRGEEETTSP